MNKDEITHILKHLLAHSRARFLRVFASDKHPPLNRFNLLFHAVMFQTLIQPGKAGPTG
ncbi:MAG: hypothetical protein FD188_2836 [Ignavibacteria bacterium]|nr:MAG: hypothetical protein FD188_2836 [Ignavibacteria bacterium]